MTSSKSPKPAFRNIPAPSGAAKPSAYARFTPGEELGSFTTWQPGSLSGTDQRQGTDRRAAPAAPAEPPKPPAAIAAEQIRAARQSGYQDGYRDGLTALDGFKQSFATQITAQVGVLAAAYGAQLDALQQDMARALAVTATNLARQIVRSELSVRPELVATVADEALGALLLSGQHITVRVNPDDHALIKQGAGEALAARGARLVNDPQISRGGCLIESTIGVVDATIEARWLRASGALGCEAPWVDADDAAPQ